MFSSAQSVLKKPGSDPDDHEKSNLPFSGKLLEHAVSRQLQHHLALVHHHLALHKLLETFQSSLGARHRTETALVRATNDLLMNADSGAASTLILLDLNAAFDTISHTVLLDRIEKLLGLSDTGLVQVPSHRLLPVYSYWS